MVVQGIVTDPKSLVTTVHCAVASSEDHKSSVTGPGGGVGGEGMGKEALHEHEERDSKGVIIIQHVITGVTSQAQRRSRIGHGREEEKKEFHMKKDDHGCDELFVSSSRS